MYIRRQGGKTDPVPRQKNRAKCRIGTDRKKEQKTRCSPLLMAWKKIPCPWKWGQAPKTRLTLVPLWKSRQGGSDLHLGMAHHLDFSSHIMRSVEDTVFCILLFSLSPPPPPKCFQCLWRSSAIPVWLKHSCISLGLKACLTFSAESFWELKVNSITDQALLCCLYPRNDCYISWNRLQRCGVGVVNWTDISANSPWELKNKTLLCCLYSANAGKCHPSGTFCFLLCWRIMVYWHW